jgi:hypothetical protein
MGKDEMINFMVSTQIPFSVVDGHILKLGGYPQAGYYPARVGADFIIIL